MAATFQRETTRQAAPADVAPAKRLVMSMDQQADLLQYLVDRCLMADGSIAGVTTMSFERHEVQDLARIATRLKRMAPFEDDIRQMVTGG